MTPTKKNMEENNQQIVVHKRQLPVLLHRGNAKRKRLNDDETQAMIDEIEAQAVLDELNFQSEQREENSLWSNWKVFYILAQKIWKQMRTDFINTPSHVCVRGECHLDRLQVSIYRYRKNDTFLNIAKDGTQKDVDTYHICFPDQCVHLQGHACSTPQQCPHRFNPSSENVKELKNLWVCRHTGVFHVCGSLCQQSKIKTDKEGHLICPLTGVQIMSTFGDDGTETKWTNEYDNPLLTMTENELKHKIKTDKFIPDAKNVPPWDRQGDLMQYRMIVELIVDELFFSEVRQTYELERIVVAYRKATTEAFKKLRPKKIKGTAVALGSVGSLISRNTVKPHLPLPSLTEAWAVLKMYAPKSNYFKSFPIIPKMESQINDVIDKTISLKRHPTFEHTPSDVASGKCRHCAVVTLRSRIDAYVDKLTDSRYKKTITHWDSPGWKTFMAETKKTIADVCIQVWKNLNKFTYDKSTGNEDLPFTRIVLSLIYLMREDYRIELPNGPATQILVIPKVHITSYLPEDTALSRFTLPKRCPSSPKILTSVQGAIQERFSYLVNNNQAHEIRYKN